MGFAVDKGIREGLSEVAAFALNLNDNKQPQWEDPKARGPSKAKAQQGDRVRENKIQRLLPDLWHFSCHELSFR